METFKDEIKNLKAITRVIAACVLANFVIIALVVGPDSVGYCLLYTSPSPRDRQKSRMPSSA